MNLVDLMCEFVEAMNPSLHLSRFVRGAVWLFFMTRARFANIFITIASVEACTIYGFWFYNQHSRAIGVEDVVILTNV